MLDGGGCAHPFVSFVAHIPPQLSPASSRFLVERDQALLSYTFAKLPNVFRRLFKGSLGLEFKGTNLLNEVNRVFKFEFY